MGLSDIRTREIATGYIERQARRNRHLRPVTTHEARRLQTWLLVFWLNQDLLAKLSRFPKERGDPSGQRRLGLRDYLSGRDQEIDKYEDDALQVSRRAPL